MPKYTKAQKKAYHSGKAYRLGRAGRKIKFSNARNRRSFQQGFRSLDGKMSRYPKAGR